MKNRIFLTKEGKDLIKTLESNHINLISKSPPINLRLKIPNYNLNSKLNKSYDLPKKQKRNLNNRLNTRILDNQNLIKKIKNKVILNKNKNKNLFKRFDIIKELKDLKPTFNKLNNIINDHKKRKKERILKLHKNKYWNNYWKKIKPINKIKIK